MTHFRLQCYNSASVIASVPPNLLKHIRFEKSCFYPNFKQALPIDGGIFGFKGQSDN